MFCFISGAFGWHFLLITCCIFCEEILRIDVYFWQNFNLRFFLKFLMFFKILVVLYLSLSFLNFLVFYLSIDDFRIFLIRCFLSSNNKHILLWPQCYRRFCDWHSRVLGECHLSDTWMLCRRAVQIRIHKIFDF